MNKHTASTFIPIKPSNKILMQLRDDGNGKKIPYPNMWNFLGGAKEEKEDHLAAAIREAEKECNLKTEKENYKLIFVYDHDNTFSDHIFVVRVNESWEPEIKEGREMAWMILEEIKNLELAYEQKRILSALEKYINYGQR